MLGDEELRVKVERLTKSDLERNEEVRRVAREQLKLWGAAKAPEED